MKKSFIVLMKILLNGGSSSKFIISVILSFAFSIAVVLSTIGIMDGFDETLKKGLKEASGDFTLYHQEGSFHLDEDLKNIFQRLGITQYAPYIQIEGFLIADEQSHAVVIKGIDAESFKNVSGLKIHLKSNKIVLGKEIQKSLQLHRGSEVTLAFANGNNNFSSLPYLRRFQFSDTISHGIYKKDLRFVYVLKSDLQESLRINHQINTIAFNLPSSSSVAKPAIASSTYLEELDQFENLLNHTLGREFIVKPFWKEFGPLIEAVQVEKFIITLVLQLVVIVSIFNVMAFIIFLNERHSQEIFLLQALGVSKKELKKVWFLIVIGIWLVACFLSVILAQLFDFLLGNLSILQMPGDIYNLTRFNLKISLLEYVFVFVLAFVWIIMIALVSIMKIHKKSILSGLRKEFS